jgi:hypothetical protein
MDQTYENFLYDAERATDKGMVLKFPRYQKNLRYNLNGLYSYSTKIADIDFRGRTITSRGKWSPTSTRHYNYVRNLLQDSYGFQELSR